MRLEGGYVVNANTIKDENFGDSDSGESESAYSHTTLWLAVPIVFSPAASRSTCLAPESSALAAVLLPSVSACGQLVVERREFQRDFVGGRQVDDGLRLLMGLFDLHGA
jgi:hypothetical protein